MTPSATIPATQARKQFFGLIKKIDNTNMPLTVTVRGTPKVVIVDAQEFESWQETLDIMSSPETVKGIDEGKRDVRQGRSKTFEEIFGKTPREVGFGKGR